MPFAAGKFDPSEAGRRSGEARKGMSSVPPSSGPVDLLAEYRAILTRPESQDATPFQKSLRKQYKTDFDGFMDRLVKLEVKEGGQKQGEQSAGPDEGSSAALQALDRWLLARKEGRADADG